MVGMFQTPHDWSLLWFLLFAPCVGSDNFIHSRHDDCLAVSEENFIVVPTFQNGFAAGFTTNKRSVSNRGKNRNLPKMRHAKPCHVWRWPSLSLRAMQDSNFRMMQVKSTTTKTTKTSFESSRDTYRNIVLTTKGWKTAALRSLDDSLDKILRQTDMVQTVFFDHPLARTTSSNG